MVGENRLGKLLPQMLTERELLTQSPDTGRGRVAKDGKFECGPTSLSLGKPR